MPPLMQRIEGEVLKGKQRTKNRIREHAHHGWEIERNLEGLSIVFMRCPAPCSWSGWMPRAEV